MKNFTLSRRTFLHGLGTALALPPLEAMAAKTGSSKSIPLRMGFSYIPNGVILPQWRTTGEGSKYNLSSSLRSLEPFKSDIQALDGLDHKKANANGDGGGDHARANATFLTGCQARKTAGSDIRIGVSVDQLAAEHVGKKTKLPSLELSTDRARLSGGCDSGYSCAYQYNLAWKTESLPMPPEANPRSVFERLFSNGLTKEQAESRIRRLRHEKSLLDFVLEDAKSLQRDLGRTDRSKLDEYLTSVRELEQRIENSEQLNSHKPTYPKPEGIPSDYRTHLRVQFDLMALAFQTDATRVATFLLAHDGSNRSFPDIGVPEGHHSLSHHRENKNTIVKLAKIDRFYADQFAYFLKKIKSVREVDGSSMLDHCMIVYGGGISDGNRHGHEKLPILLAGGRAAGLSAGRRHDFKGKPLANLYLSLLERMGVDADVLGDSTGKLVNI